MYKLQVMQGHDHQGEKLYLGDIIEVKDPYEAERLLTKGHLNFKYFRLLPGSPVPATVEAEQLPIQVAKAVTELKQAEVTAREELNAGLAVADAAELAEIAAEAAAQPAKRGGRRA